MYDTNNRFHKSTDADPRARNWSRFITRLNKIQFRRDVAQIAALLPQIGTADSISIRWTEASR